MDNARLATLHSEPLALQPAKERRLLALVSAAQNRDAPAVILQSAREFFHDRRFAGAADRQIADGDDLYPQGGVAENADVVKEAAGLDEDLENFRERQQRNPQHGGPLAAALFKDDFEDEGFNRFGPGSEAFAHRE